MVSLIVVWALPPQKLVVSSSVSTTGSCSEPSGHRSATGASASIAGGPYGQVCHDGAGHHHGSDQHTAVDREYQTQEDRNEDREANNVVEQ
jgi:hypothetical protein